MPAEACDSRLPSASGVGCMDLLSVRRITHLDLFSGIGGFALAAQAAGFSTVGFSEIEPYACKILKRHWPDVPNYGDIRNVRGVRCDLITGGFPCQPFSVAGKRRGSEDDRHLWPEMCRVIAEARPTWVLGENVPGIIGMELDRVLSDLETLGYACWPLIIPACAVDARHRRDRVWIVAHSGSGEGEQRCDSEMQRRRARKAKQTRMGGRSLAHAMCNGSSPRSANPQAGQEGNTTITHDQSGDVSNDGRGRSEGTRPSIGGQPQPARWQPEPGVGRVADGIPNRAHRLRGLGNAIVPQVAETLIREMARTLNKDSAT
jgi:DNA (cytosine-5)-methyltransferase 1